MTMPSYHDFNLTPGDLVRHEVINGQVQCSQLGRIEIDTCFYCAAVKNIEVDSAAPYVSCRPAGPDKNSSAEQGALERLGLLQLAQSLGNVSEACRQKGVSRKQFYHFKHLYETKGLMGLMDAQTVNHQMWNSEILAISQEYPEWGCHKVRQALAQKGIHISAPTIQAVLNRYGRGKKPQRLKKTR